jgi:hypothetical protein
MFLAAFRIAVRVPILSPGCKRAHKLVLQAAGNAESLAFDAVGLRFVNVLGVMSMSGF